MSDSEKSIVHREIAVVHRPKFGLHTLGVGLEIWLQKAGCGQSLWFSVEDVESFLILAKIKDISELDGRPVVAESKDGEISLRPYVAPILR